MPKEAVTPSIWRQKTKQTLVFLLTKGAPLLLLIGGFYWLWLQTTILLPVKQISVTGSMQEVSSGELRDAVKPLLKEGFIRMDVQAIRDAVEALPWVSHATVRRQWPDTLALEVKEQQMLARWGEDALVNLEGMLFYPSIIEVDVATPQFAGVENLSHKVTAAYRQYQSMLTMVGLSIVGIEVSERRAWVIELNNGIKLVLGREPQEQRIARFINVYRGGLAEQAARISRVDLRYSNGFSISWKENKIG